MSRDEFGGFPVLLNPSFQTLNVERTLFLGGGREFGKVIPHVLFPESERKGSVFLGRNFYVRFYAYNLNRVSRRRIITSLCEFNQIVVSEGHQFLHRSLSESPFPENQTSSVVFDRACYDFGSGSGFRIDQNG